MTRVCQDRRPWPASGQALRLEAEAIIGAHPLMVAGSLTVRKAIAAAVLG